MDWNLAIERNREALKRILAALVALAALVVGPHPEVQASGKPRATLPRHLHRAVLRLLRPTESAARRLVIVMARGLVVTLAPPRPRKAKLRPTILRKPRGTGILMPRVCLPSAPPRVLALPLLDPLRRFRPRRPEPSGVPRISVPGVTAPFPVATRCSPSSDDPVDATRLALRLQAIQAALDDLPRHAQRFARWRARKKTGQTRRTWPLRPGRPPGQRRANRRTHEVHDILSDLHSLAFDVLEQPDTS